MRKPVFVQEHAVFQGGPSAGGVPPTCETCVCGIPLGRKTPVVTGAFTGACWENGGPRLCLFTAQTDSN